MGMSLTRLCAPLCTVEKQPKAAAKVWFDTSEVHANEHEKLFFALQLCAHASVHKTAVGELNEWASRVLRLESSAADQEKEQWTPTQGENGWPLSNKVSTLFDPMKSAYQFSWTGSQLDCIGVVMQLWNGAGQIDGLQGLSWAWGLAL